MINILRKIFGLGPQVDYKQLLKDGAIILDVRSKGEYTGGHINGSINIAVDTLSQQIGKLDKDKTIITCCASGMRSAAAKSILKSNGFKQVFNGEGWMGLQQKIE